MSIEFDLVFLFNITNAMYKTLLKRAIIILSLLIILVPLWGQLERDSVTVIMDAVSLERPKVADMDGDGDMDIIGSRIGLDGHFGILFNTDGEGTLSWPHVFGDSVWKYFPSAKLDFEVADMDNDSDIDVVGMSRARLPYPYWENDGEGNFELLFPSEAPSSSPAIIKVSDMNNDGWQDIIYVLGDKLYINNNGGLGGAFVEEEKTSLPWDLVQGTISHKSIVIIDYDEDGDQDVIVVTAIKEGTGIDIESHLRIDIIGQEEDAYIFVDSLNLLYSNQSGSQYNFDISSIDLNSDTYDDLVFTLEPGNSVLEPEMLLLRNEGGTGSFSIQDTLSDYIYHHPFDVDMDGDEDILAIKLINELVVPFPLCSYEWLENTGDYSFIPHAIDSVFTGYRLFTADLNSDGYPDILTSNTPENKVFFFGDESQVFARYSAGDVGSYEAPVALTGAFAHIRDYTLNDWNGDSTLDVLIAVDDGVRLITNVDANDNFSAPEQLLGLSGKLQYFKFAYLDDDNLPDGVGTIGSSDVSGITTFVWFGHSPDSITFLDVDLNTGSHFSLGDYDADGDIDVLAFHSYEEFVVFSNELADNGLFIKETGNIPWIDDAIGHTNSKDINQDGKIDLWLSNLNRAYFSLQQEDGVFSDWILVPGVKTRNEVFLGDYNQDGFTDIRYRKEVGDDYYLFMQRFDTAQVNFSGPINLGLSHNLYKWYELSLNGDNVPDIVSQYGFRLGIGTSGYLTENYVPSPFTPWLYPHVYVQPQKVDLNNDGKPELVAADYTVVCYELDFLQNDYVSGRYLWDTTGNCIYDSLYPPIPNGQLTLNSGINQQHTTTTPNGNYGFYLPSNSQHILAALPLSEYWDVCPTDTLISGNSSHEVNFVTSVNTLCPLMDLEMSLSPIRQCFPSTISMAYQNIGTITASPVTVTLRFDERMTPIESVPPWLSMTDTTLTYELDEVLVGEKGQIVIEMEPDCQNLVLGEILCYEASITPDTLCMPALSDWDGASLEASYYCEGDSLYFRVENTGSGAMASPQSYYLNIVNDDIVLFETGELLLDTNEADTIQVAASPESYLFEVEQSEGHPNPELISLLAEGCIVSIDTQIINAFPTTNGDNFSVEHCGTVIGPYDPNIKVGIPSGQGEQHFISADQAIQYTIHFQNVGTDMARTVTIRDQLSDQLDLTTFKEGAASHENEWIILPDRTLSIVFEDINLPDSTSNEAGSHGFFSYSLEPVENILPYTSIQNEAAIYFDFNPPIITNRTEHLIEKPFVAITEHVMLCPGESYFGEVIMEDTIIKELYEFPEFDSIVWHHLNVYTGQDTVYVTVALEESGQWQGIDIDQDTVITTILMSEMGCDSIVSYEIIISSINNPGWAKNILLSPNPSNNIARLEWTLLPIQEGMIRIYQAQGILIAEQAIKAGEHSASWQVKDWAPGVYLIEMHIGKQIARWRLVRS